MDTGLEQRGSGVPAEGLAAGKRVGDELHGLMGGGPCGLPDGAALPPELAAQIRFFDEECEREVMHVRQKFADAKDRWVAGYASYGDSWKEKDLDRDIYEEELDALNYRIAKLMRQGL
jgi:hypothetical protein